MFRKPKEIAKEGKGEMFPVSSRVCEPDFKTLNDAAERQKMSLSLLLGGALADYAAWLRKQK